MGRRYTKEKKTLYFNCLQTIKFVNILNYYDIKVIFPKESEEERAFTEMFKEMYKQLSEEHKSILHELD